MLQPSRRNKFTLLHRRLYPIVRGPSRDNVCPWNCKRVARKLARSLVRCLLEMLKGTSVSAPPAVDRGSVPFCIVMSRAGN